MLELNMGYIEVGFRGHSEKDPESFTEAEMKLLTCFSLGTLAGVVGVGHMMNEKIDKDAGWTGGFRISVEEAYERITLWKKVDISRGGDNSSWKNLKDNCPVPDEWEKLTELDFLKKMANNGWSCNWGNQPTAWFVHKMGWDYGYSCVSMGYFHDYIPVAQNFDWQTERMQDIAVAMAYMHYNYEPKIHIDHCGSEEFAWWNDKRERAFHGLQQMITPMSKTWKNENGWPYDHRKSVPMYDGIFDIDMKDNGKIVIKKRIEEEY